MNKESFAAWFDQKIEWLDKEIAALTDERAGFLADYWLPPVYREALAHAENLGLLNVADALGAEPQWHTCVTSKSGIGQLKMFQARLNAANDALAGIKPTATVIVSPNDDRDKWMYEKRLAGLSRELIAIDLKSHREWGQLSTQGVGQAIDAYCNRQGKARIRRKRAPTKKSKRK